MVCTKCKEEKDLSEFYFNGKGKKNDSRCKDCLRILSKERYHAKGGIETVRKWRKDNTELYKGQIKLSKERQKIRIKVDPIYRDRINTLKRENSKKHFISNMYARARQRSQKYGYEFTITLEDIIVPDKCPLLEVPLILGTKGNYRFSPSIDRIDSSKGYIKDNIRVISSIANTMKSNATSEELTYFAKNIMNYLKYDIV